MLDDNVVEGRVALAEARQAHLEGHLGRRFRAVGACVLVSRGGWLSRFGRLSFTCHRVALPADLSRRPSCAGRASKSIRKFTAAVSDGG